MPTPVVAFAYKRNIRKANDHRLLSISDGDTPNIQQPVRMVSCDTPEKAQYAGLPETSQPKLDRCKARLESGFYSALPQGLRDYLATKITSDAAERHVAAAKRASEVFTTLMEDRLSRPSGTKRRVAVIPTGEIIDTYGRMLAYLAPFYAPPEPLPPPNDPLRRTFNLDMIESGWAAFFPVYPSLPQNADMNLAIAAAEAAWENQRGAWSEFGSDLLLGYEYRMCIKLSKEGDAAADRITDAFERTCIDLRNMTSVGEFGFPSVPPCYRLWVWTKDIAQATVDLQLN
jgi:endonuclease YncB( thermonuclease family)